MTLFKAIPEALETLGGMKVSEIITRRIAFALVSGGLGEMSNISSPVEALSYIYKIFGLKDGDYEVTTNNDHISIRIYKCPFREFIEENASGCSISLGIKKGLLEHTLGKRVHLVNSGMKPLLLRTAHMPSGDPYCEFKLYLD